MHLCHTVECIASICSLAALHCMSAFILFNPLHFIRSHPPPPSPAPPPCSFSGAQKRVPRILRGPQRQAVGAKVEVATSPLLLGGPKEGGNATSLLHSRGSLTLSGGSKIRSGYLTLAFSGAQKRAEMLYHPCILGGPQRQAQGAKSELATSPLPSRGPKRGRKCYVTPAL